MKRIFIFGLLATSLSLYACKDNNASKEGSYYGETISNAETTPTTMDGKPVPHPSVAAASSEASSAADENKIDVDAPSDSKGVGEFANVDVKVGKTVDAAMAAKGKELFQASCTACHTLTKQQLVGPGLAGITKIRTPQWIMNMILTPIKMTKEDPVAKQLKEDLNGVQMTPMGISKDGAREIYEFFRQNDGVQ